MSLINNILDLIEEVIINTKTGQQYRPPPKMAQQSLIKQRARPTIGITRAGQASLTVAHNIINNRDKATTIANPNLRAK